MKPTAASLHEMVIMGSCRLPISGGNAGETAGDHAQRPVLVDQTAACLLAYNHHLWPGRVCRRQGGTAVCGACVGDVWVEEGHTVGSGAPVSGRKAAEAIPQYPEPQNAPRGSGEGF